jgi:hypothetical protein
MDDKLKVFELNGRWSVGFNNTEIVAFAGPDARARAERQWAELTQLLSATHSSSAAQHRRELLDDRSEPLPSPATPFVAPI